MCGRFSLTSPVEALRRLFGFSESPNLAPRYNIAPTTDITAIRLAQDESGWNPHYFSAHWGLIPSWSKSADFSAKMINARSETVTEKPAFRSAFKSRRCLIPANGFYEWEKIGKSGKQPWLIGVKDAPLFAFAGLWEIWRSPKCDVIESCTILTTTASESISFIHPRTPVILKPADYTNWLSGRAGPEILKPLASESLSFYKVSPRVGSVRNDDPDLLKPLESGGSASKLI